MITLIEPEVGGESAGIVRVELSCPFSLDELRSLRGWFDEGGWSIEVDQIDGYFKGEGIDA